ncbi:MAG: gamma carbonic anhydrase family protein, partial [Verrucomicrobia bacterium]|nr:gamma carbonic anhydrase family protein [Verrucomicrobiota bacterium]
VSLNDYSSVWFNAVLRGGIQSINIGHHSNIQDISVIHLSEGIPCNVGDYVTVGHHAILHSCTVEDQSLIGMNATILDGAAVGTQSIIGANALVPEGFKVPPRTLALGCPAKVKRELTEDEFGKLKSHAEAYAEIASFWIKHGILGGGAAA